MKTLIAIAAILLLSSFDVYGSPANRDRRYQPSRPRLNCVEPSVLEDVHNYCLSIGRKTMPSYWSWPEEADCYRRELSQLYRSGSRHGGDPRQPGVDYPELSYLCVAVNVHGKYAEGGGCNVHGCYDAGGGCNVHGCYEAGGSCNVHGCIRQSRNKGSRKCIDF